MTVVEIGERATCDRCGATLPAEQLNNEARTPIARVTWQTWRSRGKGPPYYQIGRRCLYRWAEVLAWLESHRTEPKAS